MNRRLRNPGWHGCRGSLRPLGVICVMTLLMTVFSGCLSSSPPEARRADPYQPVAPGRDMLAGSTVASQPTARPDGPTATVPDVSAAASDRVDPQLAAQRREAHLRALQPGDRLEVYLHGIPDPQELPAVVNERGFMTMPLIGQVNVAGKTGSEVERLIERRYVDEGYYRSITCVVIPPFIQFFVRGEVQQPGRYPLSRDVTLLQAIALAGGYTEYAQPRRITILRGSESFKVNAQRIERGEDVPPPIEPGDIIVVPRRWW